MITKHPIYQEFPEYAEKIQFLYHNDDEFQVLLNSYSNLDEKIYKIEKDVWTVCFALPGKERPKAFSTKSGTGEFIHVWKKK